MNEWNESTNQSKSLHSTFKKNHLLPASKAFAQIFLHSSWCFKGSLFALNFYLAGVVQLLHLMSASCYIHVATCTQQGDSRSCTHAKTTSSSVGSLPINIHTCVHMMTHPPSVSCRHAAQLWIYLPIHSFLHHTPPFQIQNKSSSSNLGFID